MFSEIKEKAIAKGMGLLSSPVVARAMESEKLGTILEKAMSLPIRISDEIRSHREKLTSFMEIATVADMDELKRTIARLEDELNALRNAGEKK